MSVATPSFLLTTTLSHSLLVSAVAVVRNDTFIVIALWRPKVMGWFAGVLNIYGLY
jgi:hypothetical protein